MLRAKDFDNLLTKIEEQIGLIGRGGCKGIEFRINLCDLNLSLNNNHGKKCLAKKKLFHSPFSINIEVDI